MLRSFFKRLKSGTEELNYGREIIAAWGADAYYTTERVAGRGAARPFRALDIGCGHGTDLKNIRAAAGDPADLELHGVESFAPNVKECRAAGIATYALDIERDSLPGADGDFDLVSANQVLEHTKEVFWICAEAARVLRPGGRLIVGVPNIASLHNRLLLLFGQQPTQIQTLSAHVRGFTKPDFRRFIEAGAYYRLIAYRGSNFYPFPPGVAKPLARLFPTLAWGSFYLLERTEKRGDFLECLGGDGNFLETPFYGGPQNPARKTRRKLEKPPQRRAR
jgi:SAM-dependent methyltransferase